MALKREHGDNEVKGLCKLAINEELTIYVIDSLKQALTEEIAGCDRFELHLGDVEEIDSAGIQLLLALRDELMRKKKELKLTGMSAVVSKLMNDYGVSDRFNIGDAA
ncbi:MAG: STAS domain-containing protein [Gammaproteobacteria bacterium]|nr:STAS domain-containing protein [Gammaproteobacteria bacterium]